jgi:SAM-dependent methyltransferase
MSSAEKNFLAYSKYYDLLYQDKDYKAEVSYLVNLLSRCSITSGRLLEFGAGTGKHAALLAERGFDILGIELSSDMVARAPACQGLQIIQGDIATAKGKGTYDAVISLFHVISYQVENAQLIKVFENAINHLDIGGMFIFDFWYSPAVCEQRPSIKVKRIHDGEISITRLAEPKISSLENRVDVNYTIFVEDTKTSELTYFKENHPMRHFTLPELDLIAEGVGFRRVVAEEFGSGNVPSESTWGVCVAFERVN